MKLDLGCGRAKRPGFTGVDRSPDCAADIVHDLTVRPWPFADGSVEEVYCAQFLEHLDGTQRIGFMEELHRVLRPQGSATIITPYWTSGRAVQDPTHQWPPLLESSYLYFNKRWREEQGIGHYAIRCDFDFRFAFQYTDAWAAKSADEKNFARIHYLNVVTDLHVFLTRR
jgi:SAM-dependent methyltransferase